jgi:hypothetical protein
MPRCLVPPLLAALVAASGAAGAQQPASSADHGLLGGGVVTLLAGVDYSTGKYGQATATDILYVPFTARYEVDKWLFGLTVPFISVTGPGNVVRDVGAVANRAAAARRADDGLGDVIGQITRNVFEATSSGTLVDFTGKIKFGTASASKGLGTGENDYLAQVDLTQRITSLIAAFGSVGYRFVGNPPGANLHNAAYGEVGGAYKISDATRAGLIFDASQAIGPSGPQADVTAYLSQQLSRAWKVQVYGVRGFANGSPDWEGGGMVIFKF